MKEEFKRNSPCDKCAHARGLDDGLVMSPGDKPGDCVWCINSKLIEEYHYEGYPDDQYGFGTRLYKVGVLDEDTNVNCKYFQANVGSDQ